MRHLLDKHIPIVNALHTILGSFGGNIMVMAFFGGTPSGRRGASCEILTTTVDQQASILHEFGPFH